MHALETIAGLEAQDATREDAQATAAAWVAAKEAEKAAEKALAKAKADRVKAGEVLKGMLADGDTVTVNGNARYTFTVSHRSRVVDSKVLAALAVLKPEVAPVIEAEKAKPTNRTAFDVIALKRERV